MSLQYRIISMGALARNRLWNEKENRRLSHATTTLIQDDEATILVDPSLPPEALTQRLDERCGLTPDKIDVVFLTTFRPVHRRSLQLFSSADWVMHEPEITAVADHLNELCSRNGGDIEDEEVALLLRQEQSLLSRIHAADEKLTRQVHLFPAAGVSPGSAGLLLATPTRTIVIAGDAVLSKDYYDAGRVFEQSVSIDAAQESFAEIIQIADEIVPGHDNVFNVVTR